MESIILVIPPFYKQLIIILLVLPDLTADCAMDCATVQVVME